MRGRTLGIRLIHFLKSKLVYFLIRINCIFWNIHDTFLMFPNTWLCRSWSTTPLFMKHHITKLPFFLLFIPCLFYLTKHISQMTVINKIWKPYPQFIVKSLFLLWRIQVIFSWTDSRSFLWTIDLLRQDSLFPRKGSKRSYL